MKKIIKKRYLVLGIITFFISILVIFILSNNENAKMELSKNQDNQTDNNSTIPIDETVNANNEIMQTIVDSNIETEQINIVESIKQDTTPKITNDNSTQEKQVVKPTEQISQKKTEEKQTKETTYSKTEEKQQETIVSNTKDETSNTETTKPVETTTKQENQQTDNYIQEEQTSPKPSKPVDTIKRISSEELQAEKAKYLKDIQTIVPGLEYKEVKRGQVFWPYRTLEIEIAVGGANFGIVYYYVDVFIEGNQEKFKYYIDWAGNE